MNARERTIQYYLLRTGPLSPFRRWQESLGEDSKAAVAARIARFRGGNFGDSRPIGEGASESRIDFGPGYRIYYGIYGDLVVLLHGGDKSSQVVDIQIARSRWRDYKERKREEDKRSGLQKRPSRRSPK
jgi:putative addiction module killer protein